MGEEEKIPKYIPMRMIREFADHMRSTRSLNPHIRYVLAGGCFDPFHGGHLEYLERAKKYGNVLLANVVNRYRLEEKKNTEERPKPIQSQQERLKTIEGLEIVNHCFAFECDPKYDPTFELAFILNPDVIVQPPENWTREIIMRVKEELGKGVKRISLKRSGKRSSSRLVERILEVHGVDNGGGR